MGCAFFVKPSILKTIEYSWWKVKGLLHYPFSGSPLFFKDPVAEWLFASMNFLGN